MLTMRLNCDTLLSRVIVYKVVASRTRDRREVVWMELFTFQDLILFATFLIALLTYIDRKNKQK